VRRGWLERQKEHQRAQAIKRRRQIWEALHPNSGNSFSTIPADEPRGRGRPPEFASETAAAAGMTKQAINQHLARADALGDDLERISERVEIGRALEGEIGQRQGQRTDLQPVENFPQVEPGAKTRDLAAKAAGFGNGKPRAWRAPCPLAVTC